MLRYIVAVATVLVGAALAAPASAEPRHHHDFTATTVHWQPRSHWHRPHPASPGFWGGVVGGTIGGLLAGRDRDADEADLEPWSRAWFEYCSRRYRTFDPRTGRYFGFDGEFHFCKA